MINIPIEVVNYIDYLMLKYASIYPNPLRVLEHIFFVNGNGYSYKNNTICEYIGNKEIPIENVLKKNKIDYVKSRNAIAIDFFVKSLKDSLSIGLSFHERLTLESFSDFIKKTSDRNFKEMKSLFDAAPITENELSIDSLRNQLTAYNQSVYDWLKRTNIDDVLPYPISKGYAICYNMNEQTPKWIVQLCYNISFVYLEFMKGLPSNTVVKSHNLDEMISEFEEVVTNCKMLLNEGHV